MNITVLILQYYIKFAYTKSTEFLKFNSSLLRLQILKFSSRLLIEKNIDRIFSLCYTNLKIQAHEVYVWEQMVLSYLLDEKGTLQWMTSNRVLEISLGLNLKFLIINHILNCFKMPMNE